MATAAYPEADGGPGAGFPGVPAAVYCGAVPQNVWPVLQPDVGVHHLHFGLRPLLPEPCPVRSGGGSVP